MQEFIGKTAIITGAARDKGIGYGIAYGLAKKGARVILHDRGKIDGPLAPSHGVGTLDELLKAKKNIEKIGAQVEIISGDMTKEADVQKVISFSQDIFGSVDILVNNAAVGYLFGPITEFTQEEWDTVMEVNLRGVFFGIKHAAKQMIKQGNGGRIINIASQAGKSGFANAAAYTASKHGVIGLTRSAALELSKYRITVNAICPNHITTGLGAWQNEYMSKLQHKTVDEYLQAMRERIPLRREGRVEDIVSACCFLCSEEANYVTAEAMNVSGGEEYH